MKQILRTTLFLFLAASFSAVHAQEVYEEVILSDENFTQAEMDAMLFEYFPDSNPVNDSINEATIAKGNTSCFDHYDFGSVQVQLTTDVSGTVAGAPITVQGVIKNANQYPIVDGTVYIRIFKLADGSQKNVNGPAVVDQFIAAQQVNLVANGTQNFSFNWNVPVWAKNGKYQVASFFVSNLKYNLLGLTFTDDIVGNTTEFTVSNGVTTGVYFDKSAVQVNGELYHFAAFPPRLSKDEPVTITAQIINDTNQVATVPVSFKSYYWDAMRGENKLAEERDVVSVPANSSLPITYTVTNTDFPVYYSEIVLVHRDAKSILNPRFVREGISRARINFPAIKTYPLVANKSAEVFTCLHSTSDENVINGRLELEVFDVNNQSIHSFEYEGIITSDMMGLIDTFVPEQSHETFSVQARLYQDGILLEEDLIVYNCNQLGGCKGIEVGMKKTMSGFFNNPLNGLIAVMVIGILLLIFIAVYLFKKMKK